MADRLNFSCSSPAWSCSQTISDVAKHLRCGECGGKHISTLMTFEEPTGAQPVGLTDREWEQHIRDQRRVRTCAPPYPGHRLGTDL